MKKILLIIVTLLLSLLFAEVSAQTQTVQTPTPTPNNPPLVTIRPDGSINPETTSILRNGDIYTLQENLIGGITVKRNNTVFDGNGHTLSGWGKFGDGGFEIRSVENVTLKNLVFTNLWYAVSLLSAKQSIVFNNTIRESISVPYLRQTASFHISGGSSNIIVENNFIGNINATAFFSTTNNTIVANNFIGSSGVACLLYASSNNLFYHNNFINNRIQVLDIKEANYPFVVQPSINTWDNGSVGNYWIDYNGTDSNGDSVGDSPYLINTGNMDNNPLVSQFDIEKEIFVLPTLDALSTPTPSVPEFSSWTLPLLLSIVALIAGLLVYHKKRRREGLVKKA